MEPRENASSPSESPPVKLALAAAVCAVTGVGLFGAMWLLSVATDSGRAGPSLLKQAIRLGFWISIPLGYLVAPVLAAIAGCRALGYCRQIERFRSGPVDGTLGCRTAWRLLVAAVFLALPCGLAATGAIWHGYRLYVVFGVLTLFVLSVAAVAAYAGYASARLYRQGSGHLVQRLCGLSTILVVVLVGVASTPIPNYLSYYARCSVYALGGETFSGASEDLPGTMVVATLDCPVPPQKNVVWCSSFQLAWNALRDNVIGEPVKVVGAEALAERLNTAGQSIADLEPDSVYAAAGRIGDGIVGTIKGEMSRRFPSEALPDFNDYSDDQEAIVAYSYLVAQVPFKHPYRSVERAFTFTDSNWVETEVEAFGLWEAFLSQYKKAREQMDILFARSSDPNEGPWDPDEYAIDLCKHSDPYQVVVARVDLRGSLGETLEYVRLRMSEFQKFACHKEVRQFKGNDVLTVPEMFWEIDHRFRDLIGKMVANADPSMPVVEAMQTIRFRLDRYGAAVESRSNIAIASAPRYFEFNRPFLVYMQKRGAAQPFFVMWVDNAELLTPR